MKQTSDKPIYVTQPSLAPLAEFNEYLQRVWDSGIMTHNGPLMQQLEKEVSAYEGVGDTVCVANGTCAMQLAIRALDLEGEIITTPFSFIATANIIKWERCTPVFVDVDADTWNIDPDRVERAITDKTVAILPVHVFSAPCDVRRIAQIADRHGLKVIYDAAHAMCVKAHGKSIMSYGDVACTSFHATKLFNTCEGGACFTEDAALAARLRRMRFFGFDERKEIVDDGMNAKMTEVAAGLGLANLKHLDEVRRTRREKYELYQCLLGGLDYITFQKFDPEEYNYSYMPVLIDPERFGCDTGELERRLQGHNVYGRRYFYPLLSDTAPLAGDPRGDGLTHARRIAERVFCLPLYHTLSRDDVERICGMIVESGRDA